MKTQAKSVQNPKLDLGFAHFKTDIVVEFVEFTLD